MVGRGLQVGDLLDRAFSRRVTNEEVSIEIFITVIRAQQQQDREVRTRANDQIVT